MLSRLKLLTEHNLEFLSLKGGCRGSSESTHVKMPHVGNLMHWLKYHFLSDGLLKFGPQREKTCLGVCEQHRCRPACKSAQSDQRLCNSFLESTILNLTIGEISIF